MLAAYEAMEILIHWWLEMLNGVATLEENLSSSYQIKQTLILESSNFIPRYLYKGDENLCSHEILHVDIKDTLFIIAQSWKQPRCSSVGEWIIKPDRAR